MRSLSIDWKGADDGRSEIGLANIAAASRRRSGSGMRCTLSPRSVSASAADVRRCSPVAARSFSTTRSALPSRERRKRLRLSSGAELALLVEASRAVPFLAVPIRSIERLTPQELIYLASGARLLARQAKEGADQQESPSVRQTFESAERVYLDLAAKCERLAGTSR